MKNVSIIVLVYWEVVVWFPVMLMLPPVMFLDTFPRSTWKWNVWETVRAGVPWAQPCLCLDQQLTFCISYFLLINVSRHLNVTFLVTWTTPFPCVRVQLGSVQLVLVSNCYWAKVQIHKDRQQWMQPTGTSIDGPHNPLPLSPQLLNPILPASLPNPAWIPFDAIFTFPKFPLSHRIPPYPTFGLHTVFIFI